MQTNPTTTDLTPQARLAQCRERVAELLAICDAATPGPWLVAECVDYDEGGPVGIRYDRDEGVFHLYESGPEGGEYEPETVCAPWSEADARFIATARTLTPALLRHILRELDTIAPWLLTAEELADNRRVRDSNLVGARAAAALLQGHDCALAILGGIEATLAEVGS